AMAGIIRTGSTKATVIFAISAALGFYTLPVMLYPFAMLIAWGRKKAIRAAIGAIALSLLLYSPVLVVSGFDSLISNSYVRPLPAGAFFRSLVPYAASLWSSMFVGIPLLLQLLIAAGFVIG